MIHILKKAVGFYASVLESQLAYDAVLHVCSEENCIIFTVDKEKFFVDHGDMAVGEGILNTYLNETYVIPSFEGEYFHGEPSSMGPVFYLSVDFQEGIRYYACCTVAHGWSYESRKKDITQQVERDMADVRRNNISGRHPVSD